VKRFTALEKGQKILYNKYNYNKKKDGQKIL